MRLFEHPDFEQAVIRAAEHFRPRGLREAVIEKDYYVTEAPTILIAIPLLATYSPVIAMHVRNQVGHLGFMGFGCSSEATLAGFQRMGPLTRNRWHLFGGK